GRVGNAVQGFKESGVLGPREREPAVIVGARPLSVLPVEPDLPEPALQAVVGDEDGLRPAGRRIPGLVSIQLPLDERDAGKRRISLGQKRHARNEGPQIDLGQSRRFGAGGEAESVSPFPKAGELQGRQILAQRSLETSDPARVAGGDVRLDGDREARGWSRLAGPGRREAGYDRREAEEETKSAGATGLIHGLLPVQR